MILLTTTSSTLQLVTAVAGNLAVYVAYLDNNSGTVTPASANLSPIITATTTAIVTSPSNGTQRNIKMVTVANTAAAQNNISIQHTDGVTVETLWSGALGAGESMAYNGYDFVVYDAFGVQSLNVQQSLTDRIAQKNTARQTFTSAGLRVDCGGSTVSVESIPSVAGLGFNDQLGQSIQQSQLLFQAGFRRNLVII